MIEELRLRNLGVIEDAVLALAPGLTVVTGETGAGKTMVVTALGLLLGNRADSGLVRAGSSGLLVEGRVHVIPDGDVAARVEAAGGELDEDGTLLIARSVGSEGRSRAHLGGRQVPAGILGELAGALVQVHGQGDQQRLLHPAAQRDALDRSGGPELLSIRGEYGDVFTSLRAAEAELEQVTTQRRERAAEAARLAFLLDEHERLAPVDGEDAALRAEGERLTHADALRGAADLAHAALLGDERAPDVADALGLVAAARRALEGVREHDPELAALADRLAEVSYALGDIGSDLSSYGAAVGVDPERLEWVHQRLADLSAAARARGVDGASGLNSWAADAALRHRELADDDSRVADLEARITSDRVQLTALAQRLSAARRAAGAELGERITAEVRSLAMPHAEISVAITQRRDEQGLDLDGERVAFGPTGVDDVALLLLPHPGGAARPLHRGASGGELSRLMLAVEVVLSGADHVNGEPLPTFVFDEVDAGVGGKAAVEVGRRLARLARNAQVVVVTHLPQVAAFADRHLVVEKSTDGLVTSSGVRTLDDSDRVHELSRMLAGIEGSELAQGHAEELLAAAADVDGEARAG